MYPLALHAQPIDPLQMIINLLNAIEAPLRIIASSLAVIAVIVIIIRAINMARDGALNVWQLVGSIVGVIVLWVVMFELPEIMCWVGQTMDPTFACP